MTRLPLKITWFILFLFSPWLCFGSSNGITGYSGNGQDCSACHSGGVVPQLSLVSDSGSNELAAGDTASYTLIISGGQNSLAGFNVSASAGSLNIAMADTSKMNGELKHNKPFQVNTDSTWQWQFTLTAPNTPGPLTIYAAAVSADGNGSFTGDNVALASLDITVTAASALLPPQAKIDAPASAQVNEAVTFSGAQSVKGDGAITRYLWDFGDGSALAEGVSVDHQFAQANNYIVTMAVTDDNKLTGVTYVNISIGAVGGGGDGETLYNANCRSCHGDAGGGGSAAAIAGVTLDQVNTAIATVGLMSGISLTDVQLQLIVDYLNSGVTPGPRPTDGPGLYGVLCAGCHGADGGGGTYIAVTGATYPIIQDALTNIGAMQAIVINAEEAQKVATYLAAGGGVSIPGDGQGLYQVFCSLCHGDGGHGGKFKAVTAAPLTMINSALSQEPWMQGLTLNTSQRNAIAQFLLAGGSGPLPTDGEGLFGVYCAVCHGADGRGDSYKVVTGTSLNFINRALSNVSLMRSLNPSSSQINSIGDFLASGGGGAKPSSGSGLYHVYCETCHGPNGSGGNVESVRGASAGSISSEINGQSNMRQLRPYLSSSDISLISSFLGGGSGGGGGD